MLITETEASRIKEMTDDKFIGSKVDTEQDTRESDN